VCAGMWCVVVRVLCFCALRQVKC